MVRFTDTSGRTLYINPDHVRMISEYGDGHTVVYFGGELNPTISMEINRVALMLQPEPGMSIQG